MKSYKQELRVALEAAKQASALIMQYYQQSSLEVETKSDDSPVTEADKAADAMIRSLLHQHFPHMAILSEETIDDKARLDNDYVWIVDPLDGTKDFIQKTEEFCINIALAYHHEIVLGVIAVPVKDSYYYATKEGGSFRIIRGQTYRNQVAEKSNHLLVLRSHFHGKKIEDDFLATREGFILQQRPCGSAYKTCLIASGEAHYMIKIGEGTKEWDIAASAIIVQEAGGFFSDAYGDPIHFNRNDVQNRNGFLVLNHYNPQLIYPKP